MWSMGRRELKCVGNLICTSLLTIYADSELPNLGQSFGHYVAYCNLAKLWIKIVVRLEMWYLYQFPELSRFIIRFSMLLSDTTFSMRLRCKNSCLNDSGNFSLFYRSRCHFEPAGSSCSCRREIVSIRVRLLQPCIFPPFIRLWLNDIILNVLHVMFCFFIFDLFHCNKYESRFQTSTSLWRRKKIVIGFMWLRSLVIVGVNILLFANNLNSDNCEMESNFWTFAV